MGWNAVNGHVKLRRCARPFPEGAAAQKEGAQKQSGDCAGACRPNPGAWGSCKRREDEGGVERFRTVF